MTHGKIEPYGAQFYFITLDKKKCDYKVISHFGNKSQTVSHIVKINQS